MTCTATNDPTVTVILPVHNAEATLPEAVDSICRQTLKAFELLIVDDGSTDGSSAWLAGLTDPRIRVLTLPANRGVIEARNHALREARGTFIALQDADDRSAPERLEEQVRYLNTHPEAGFVGTAYWKMSASGEPLLIRRMPTGEREIGTATETGTPFCCPSLMIRRDCLTRAGEYRLITGPAGEDLDLILRLLDFTQGANLPAPLYFYRIGCESIMSSTHQEDLLATRRLIYRIAAQRRERGVDPFTAGDPEILAAAAVIRERITRRPRPSSRQRELGCALTLTEDFMRVREYRRALHWALQALRHNPASLPGWRALARALYSRLFLPVVNFLPENPSS